MRLLFVSHSFPPRNRPLASVGGMQRVAVELSEALPSHVAVTRLVHRSAWRWHHVRCALWFGPTLIRIWRIARRGEMDAVLFSSMVTGALGLLLRPALVRRGIPMAAIAHGKDVTQRGPYQWFLVRSILRRLDAVLPVSTATGAACMARGMPEARVHVVPNGVHPERFSAIAAQRTAANAESFLVVSVGRLVRRKGFAWFVREVMPKLPPQVRYHICGAGPERDRIEQAIRDRKLHGRVRLLGKLAEGNLLDLYAAADLLVVPNIPVPGDMEGFGIVMLEAGASGVPALAARLEGIQDVITDGTNGHLISSRDADGFVRAIMRYVTDSDALQTLSDRTLAHTLAHFRWDAIAARYVRVLTNVAAPRQAPQQNSGAAPLEA